MAFTGFNTNDFDYFTGDRPLPQKKALRKKVRELEEELYNSLPRQIKRHLEMSKVGKIYSDSKDIWFALRPVGSDGGDKIGYNFDINEIGIRYCLNVETKGAIKLFKKSLVNNKDPFCRLANEIYRGKIWLEKAHSEQGDYFSKPRYWDEIGRIPMSTLTYAKIDQLIAQITNPSDYAVRIGIYKGKREKVSTSPTLPGYLNKLSRDYFNLFCLLNNL